MTSPGDAASLASSVMRTPMTAGTVRVPVIFRRTSALLTAVSTSAVRTVTDASARMNLFPPSGVLPSSMASAISRSRDSVRSMVPEATESLFC